jgi:hypothetical protein
MQIVSNGQMLDYFRANCLNHDSLDSRINMIVQQSMPLSEPKFSELLNFQNKRYCVSYSVNNYYCSNNLNSVNSGSDEKAVNATNQENPLIGGIGVQTIEIQRERCKPRKFGTVATGRACLGNRHKTSFEGNRVKGNRIVYNKWRQCRRCNKRINVENNFGFNQTTIQQNRGSI